MRKADDIPGYEIGRLLSGGGWTDDARAAFRHALAAGGTRAVHHLGVLLKEAGRTQQAETYMRRAADAGDADAAAISACS